MATVFSKQDNYELSRISVDKEWSANESNTYHYTSDLTWCTVSCRVD